MKAGLVYSTELMCRDLSYGVGFISTRLWCLQSLPFWFILCGGDWVVLWCGLKLATWYKIQSDLKMVATDAGWAWGYVGEAKL